jgi:16S rRNA G966 N2-methylase RsmD
VPPSRFRRRLGSFRRWLLPRAGLRWDRAAGVETEARAEPRDLTVEDGSVEEGFSYVPTPPRLARAVLDCLDIPLPLFTFVDMGSGRGRMLLMASERPFRRVIGVEFAAELHNAAVENIRRFPKVRRRCQDVRSIHGDAAEFTFPMDPLVLYFDNPFSETVMGAVLQHLAASHELRRRPIVVVYQQLAVENPRHSTDNLGLLDRQRFLIASPARLALFDRIALRRYLVRVYRSSETMDLVAGSPK